jgi:lipopolysaccharide transport system permease protein
MIFVGLIVFGLVTELCCRAPLLLHEHAWFLKSSIFPCEILAWIAVFRALTFAGVSLGVLLVFQLALTGTLPVTLLLLPLIVVPFTLYLLGVVWFLAALGAFTRDLSYLMASFVPLMMVATPVFYRVADLPPGVRLAAYLNPLSAVIEMARAVILGQEAFSLVTCGIFCAVSLVVFRAGHAVFAHYRGIALDAI